MIVSRPTTRSPLLRSPAGFCDVLEFALALIRALALAFAPELCWRSGGLLRPAPIAKVRHARAVLILAAGHVACWNPAGEIRARCMRTGRWPGRNSSSHGAAAAIGGRACRVGSEARAAAPELRLIEGELDEAVRVQAAVRPADARPRLSGRWRHWVE